MLTVSFVFLGLYCNYIVTKLFQCSTVYVYDREKCAIFAKKFKKSPLTKYIGMPDKEYI